MRSRAVHSTPLLSVRRAHPLFTMQVISKQAFQESYAWLKHSMPVDLMVLWEPALPMWFICQCYCLPASCEAVRSGLPNLVRAEGGGCWEAVLSLLRRLVVGVTPRSVKGCCCDASAGGVWVCGRCGGNGPLPCIGSCVLTGRGAGAAALASVLVLLAALPGKGRGCPPPSWGPEPLSPNWLFSPCKAASSSPGSALVAGDLGESAAPGLWVAEAADTSMLKAGIVSAGCGLGLAGLVCG